MKFEDLKVKQVFSLPGYDYPRWTITQIDRDNRFIEYSYVRTRESKEEIGKTKWHDNYEVWTLKNKVYRNYPKEKL